MRLVLKNNEFLRRAERITSEKNRIRISDGFRPLEERIRIRKKVIRKNPFSLNGVILTLIRVTAIFRFIFEQLARISHIISVSSISKLNSLNYWNKIFIKEKIKLCLFF